MFSLKQGKISVLQKISVSERQRFPPQPFDLQFVECTEVEFRFKGKTGVHVSLLYYPPIIYSIISVYTSVCRQSICLSAHLLAMSLAFTQNFLSVSFLRTALLSCIPLL